MHYWAKNGSPKWISSAGDQPSEYPVVGDGFQSVKYTYASASFWNNFDPKNEINPLGDNDGNINW